MAKWHTARRFAWQHSGSLSISAQKDRPLGALSCAPHHLTSAVYLRSSLVVRLADWAHTQGGPNFRSDVWSFQNYASCSPNDLCSPWWFLSNLHFAMITANIAVTYVPTQHQMCVAFLKLSKADLQRTFFTIQTTNVPMKNFRREGIFYYS